MKNRMSIITKLNTVRNANQSSYEILPLSKGNSENQINVINRIPSIYINTVKSLEN